MPFMAIFDTKIKKTAFYFHIYFKPKSILLKIFVPLFLILLLPEFYF